KSVTKPFSSDLVFASCAVVIAPGVNRQRAISETNNFINVLRGVLLQFAAPAPFGDVTRAADRKRGDGQRRILFGKSREAASVDHEQVFDVVRLAVGIQYRSLRGGAHAAGSDFVTGETAGAFIAVDHDLGPARVQDLRQAFAHIAKELQIILAPVE